MNRTNLLTGRIRRRDGMLTSDLGDGIAVMDLNQYRYLALNATAAATWQRLDVPSRFDEIIAGLCTEFDVPEATCRKQVTELLDRLLSDGLIMIEE